MASINVDLDYFDHPKTRRLVATLGRGADIIPIRLWHYCGKYHAESGTIDPPFTAEIESIVGWWGQKGQCVEALINCGFLDREGPSLSVHDWSDHAGHIHAGKVKAKAMAKARWEKLKGDDSADSNADSITPSSTDSNANAMQGKAKQGNTGQAPPKPPKSDPFFFDLIPEQLANHSPFLEAWRDYLTHRKEKGAKMTPTAAKNALAKCAAWGPDRATAAVIHSTAQGWTGIFEEKVSGPQKPTQFSGIAAAAARAHRDGTLHQEGT